MNRKHLHGALLLAAASLFAAGAYAENPHAAPQGKANAADKADDKAEKGDKDKDKADKAAKDGKDKDGKEAADSKGKSADERAARKAKEHDAQRQKLTTLLKAPMSEAIKQELRRHSERLARLDRIKAVAEIEKDKDTIEKSTKLIAKENERHDKWMDKHVATAQPAGATPPAAADGKGGAK